MLFCLIEADVVLKFDSSESVALFSSVRLRRCGLARSVSSEKRYTVWTWSRLESLNNATDTAVDLSTSSSSLHTPDK